ncbi:MAG: DEAD/DEAH box helicase [Blastocatellia bacterium]|nr:DEAD/DEAH box helicase [Blastocatellia bacterium]
MDIFEFRNSLIEEYKAYVESFIEIGDPEIKEYVEQTLSSGSLWPEALIQLNPSFAPGGFIDQLVDDQVLHQDCSKIFRINNLPLRLHKHQADAITTARSGKNYVLTTGTGSGKSLCYIIPIVDYVLREGSGKGIKAIVVYPMNALANSQHRELKKFLAKEHGKDLVTFALYTGQEGEEAREKLRINPPDILLTNYVMLDLILTRSQDQKLVKVAKGLKFLVLDELHTYRGRQGADVALLVRRLRLATAAKNLQCIGTSATIAGSGSFEECNREVAKVASQLFGAEVEPGSIIGETLQRATPDFTTSPETLAALKKRVEERDFPIPKDYKAFITDPMSSWIETTFGLKQEGHRLVRQQPRSISGKDGAAKELDELLHLGSLDLCADAIKRWLLAGYECSSNPETVSKPFAFRLHQFISRGDTVYASLEAENRYITVQGQQFVPGDRSRRLFPLSFCRECGQEYYCVRISNEGTDANSFIARELLDQQESLEGKPAFLFFNKKISWPKEPEELKKRLPENWLDETGSSIRRDRREDLPKSIKVTTEGKVSEKEGLEVELISSPFRFCLFCGVSYDFNQDSDFAKLSTLGSEGRSTATTIMSLSAIRNLKASTSIEKIAQKLLSFTDNRQDASLQAGHFNDFVETAALRSAIYKAIEQAGREGIEYDCLTLKVFETLNLPREAYSANPEEKFGARKETDQALRDVLGYRIYRDLRRGWRITSPNLEQCGLLEIKYKSLDELCADKESWKHQLLSDIDRDKRAEICKTLLDFMRRELAIKVDFLEQSYQEIMLRRSNQKLTGSWAIEEAEAEALETSRILFPRSQKRGEDRKGCVYLSGRSRFGQYLKGASQLGQKLKLEEIEKIIVELLQTLITADLVKEVIPPSKDSSVAGYQLPASAMIWTVSDGKKAFHDPIRVPEISKSGARTNKFFIDFYRNKASMIKDLQAKEHTAQVPADYRQEREEKFRKGLLPILYCSPTMELGVDISDLNVVNMRNIPPTPANYAQRSGRAGRSGQPALVLSYCTTGSSHDQYFFKRPEKMVAGSVTTPRLDLANQDLIKAHIHSIWLSFASLNLGSSLNDVLDLGKDCLPLRDEVKEKLEDQSIKEKTLKVAEEIIETLKEELKESDWYNERWLSSVVDQIGRSFDTTCARWRSLYTSAKKQRDRYHEIIGDHLRTSEERERAKRLRKDAEEQLELLKNSKENFQTDFYSYRYFASEGFLPGYNFPRLPISAFVPARSRASREDVLSRPRFLAISEFGPQAIIYHEGSRYAINNVILGMENEELTTKSIKLCPKCSYLHELSEDKQFNRCEKCNEELEVLISGLFQMQSVSTRRRNRINSDEEERLRHGYELITAVKFSEKEGHSAQRTANVYLDDNLITKLTYGDTAKLWRINLGWRRRKEKGSQGFFINKETGKWESEKDANSQKDEILSANSCRVIPYVEDWRNCLLLEPCFDGKSSDVITIASLQAALKAAIQVEFQLEDNELAVESLPNHNNRSLILFYESAEGGAGVLKRLIDDPEILARVAKEALSICHFGLDGEDERHSKGATEVCEAACYDCLMNYNNQRDHRLLDRKKVKDILLAYTKASVASSPVEQPRAMHLQELKRLSDSELERSWLDLLERYGHKLPSQAQKLVKECQTRPDFFYEENQTAIYVDGSHHKYPDRAKRDQVQQECMEDSGYMVLRFGLEDDWQAIINKYPSIFGKPQYPMK